MQWTPAGGFTGGRPWLPYGDLSLNVRDQRDDPASMLSLYRRLIWLRKRSLALSRGDYAPVNAVPDGVFAYTRTHDDERLLAVINFASAAATFDLPPTLTPRETLVATHAEPPPSQRIALRPHEARLLRL